MTNFLKNTDENLPITLLFQKSEIGRKLFGDSGEGDRDSGLIVISIPG
ncbi:MAG: hypothetical protein WB460_01410 [Candidatus Acidiferrales bacterium]